MLALILPILLSALPMLLQAFGVISPSLANLIASLTSAIPALIAKLEAGGTPTADELALLQAFQAEIVALQSNTTLDPSDLALASALNDALSKAIAAYQTAETVDDPSTLTPLPTNLTDEAPISDPNPTAPSQFGSASV